MAIQTAQTPTSAKVDSRTFVAIMWSGTAISLCFLVFRIFVRIKSFRRIFADDVIVLIAWLLFLTGNIIWQWQQTAVYEVFIIASGTVIPTSDQLASQVTLLRSELTTLILYNTSLWMIKLSFLIFFRRLSQNVRGQKIWWWCVTSFIIATWATSIGLNSWDCLLASLDSIPTKCGSTSTIKYALLCLRYNVTIDVITDAAIITIPILMLWNVHISWKKKLALMSIFSLTIIVIIFSIVRVSLITTVTPKSQSTDITWLFLWSNIEVAVSIIVSCLASFRQLFVKPEQSGRLVESDKTFLWRSGLLSAFKSFKTTSSSSPNDGSFTRKIRHHGMVPLPDSTEHIVPLTNVYVRNDTGKPSNVGQ